MPGLSDFVLIDDTHKINIYDLSLIVTTVIDSLRKSVPLRFLLAPSEHSESITTHMNLLKLTGNNCIDPSYENSRSVMTDEGSALVKVTSDMAGYHHCLCAFHINQLAVRVSSFVTSKVMLASLNRKHTFLTYVYHRIDELCLTKSTLSLLIVPVNQYFFHDNVHLFI